MLLTEDMFTKAIETIDEVQHFLGIPHFDYKPITHKNERGFTVLKNMGSKADKKGYPKMLEKTRLLMEEYYRPHNAALVGFVDRSKIQAAWGVNATA